MNKLLENHQIYPGKYSFGFVYINSEFVFHQKAEDNLEDIKDLYLFKHSVYDMMYEAQDEKYIRSLAKDAEFIELEIQKLFNFEPNANFYRFWEAPKCSCPVMDNMDRWGTGYKIYNQECIIHGEHNES